MKAYPEYKSSGIDWLGEIPSHWNRMPIKAVLSKSSAGTWGEEPREDGSDIVCFRVADFDYQHLELSHKNLTYRNVDERQLFGREVCKGDIVIEKSGGGDLWPVGRAVISKFDFKATCSNFMHVISTNNKANNLYLNYLLATIYMHGITRQYFAQTTGIQNLNIKEYLSQQACFPPIDEQEAIAAYLDDVTGKVDALIAKKQKLVVDLRSYRTSLITETVTHGLNPDAPLRHSGIDWLGDIPKHWISTKAKYYIEIKSGDPISKDNINSKGSVPIFGGGEIIGFTTESNIPAQTIIIGRVGARCGCVRLTDIEAWATDNALVVFTSQNPRFLTRIFDAANLNRLNESNAQPLITATKIKDLGIPLPPLVEQQAIAEFLDEKTEKVDALISELEKQLEELVEYKKAIISEAVTGKVDVRDWKPQN